MSLQTTIDADYKAAFKSSNKQAVSAYRMLKSAVKNAEIDAEHELTDDETRAVIAREVKRRRDALQQYQQGGRPELAAQEQFDIDLFGKYLPPPMSDQELQAIVEQTITELGVSGPSAMGKVMGAVMAKVKGQVDGNQVQTVVKQKLSG